VSPSGDPPHRRLFATSERKSLPIEGAGEIGEVTGYNLAVLVGNGLSIAFNPDLNLRVITEEMTTRISAESSDGSDVVAAMKEIAERALPSGASSDSDFEVLVGAFGAEGRTLGYLQRLAQLVSPQDEDLKDSIQRVADFAEEVRDSGISHVLQVISSRSYGDWAGAERLHKLVTQIVSTFKGRVVFGNLNYDTLLLSALIATSQDMLADMASGWQKVSIVDDDGTTKLWPALRTTASDWPNDRRVRLLHLHGSLTYWGNRERTTFAKLDAEYLRLPDQWEAVRNNATALRPAIVLAKQNDKSIQVLEYPFSLAYELFGTGLKDADHWLIVGYSFKDTPVNDLLRGEFAERETKPRVLVVTFENELTLLEVERAFGWNAEDEASDSWLSVYRGGADGAEDSNDWTEFIEGVLPTVPE